MLYAVYFRCSYCEISRSAEAKKVRRITGYTLRSSQARVHCGVLSFLNVHNLSGYVCDFILHIVIKLLIFLDRDRERLR